MPKLRTTIDGDRPRYRRWRFDKFMRWDGDVPEDVVQRLWSDPQSLLDEGQKLQEKTRGTVAYLDRPFGPLVLKSLHWGNFARTLRRSLSSTASRRSWENGHLLREAGIPTPCPRAFLERRFGPFASHSYFLTDYVAGTSLYRLLRFENPSDDAVLDMARQVAAIWDRLNDLRTCHNDFKTENFMVDPAGKVWLIDLEMVRRYRRPDRWRKRQSRELSTLLHPRNWRANPGAAEAFRQELVRTRAGQQFLQSRYGDGHIIGSPRPIANRSSQLVTALIPCHNAADTILACVESVRDMADEILIADAGSTDETLALVRAAGDCRVIQYKCDDPTEFMNWAREQAQHPWILEVRSNERLSSDLRRRVQDILATEPSELGFTIQQTHYVDGRAQQANSMRHRSGVRLFQADGGHYTLRNGKPEVVVSAEKTGHITSRLFVDVVGDTERLVVPFEEQAADILSTSKRAA